MRTPVLLLCPIHPTSWKGNSAYFAFTEFYEVRVAPARFGTRSLGTRSYPAIELLEDRLSVLVALLVIANLPKVFAGE
jgi:hypothetical protein